MLLKEQNQVSNQRGMPVDDKGASSSIVSVTEPAAIQLYYWSTGTRTSDAGQAAGVVVEAKLTYDNIKNEAGFLQATYNDTSLAFTSTALTTEVEFPWNIGELNDTVAGTTRAEQITAGFSNGEYCVDYSTGMIYGVKKTVTTTLTSVSYMVLQNQAGGTTIIASDVNIDEVGGTDVPAMNAAFGTATPLVPIAGKYMSTPTTYDDGDALPILLDANGRIVLAADIQIGAVELKNASTDERASIEAADTARTTATKVIAVQNVNADGSVNDIPTTLTGGNKTVTTGGTAEALGTTLATKSIYIRAKAGNTNDIYVGDSAVDKTTSQQIILSANDSVTLNIADRATVYIDATTNGEGVDYLAMS